MNSITAILSQLCGILQIPDCIIDSYGLPLAAAAYAVIFIGLIGVPALIGWHMVEECQWAKRKEQELERERTRYWNKIREQRKDQ